MDEAIREEARKYTARLGDGTDYYEQNHGLDLLHRVPQGRLLEIGFGNGQFLERMRRVGRNAVGVELDRAFCSEPWHVVGSACDLPFGDEVFDVVCAFDVLEHIRPERLDRSLAEMSRVVRRGGSGLFRIAFHPDPPYHLIVQPSDWWREKLGSRFEVRHFKVAADGLTGTYQVAF